MLRKRRRPGVARYSPDQQSRRTARREQSSLSSTVEQLSIRARRPRSRLGDISIATVQRAGLENDENCSTKYGLPERRRALVFHRVEQVRELARRRTAGGAMAPHHNGHDASG